MLVFAERGKPEYPEKNLSEQRREPTTKLNPHMTSSPGIEPGPHWWKASALTTPPSLLEVSNAVNEDVKAQKGALENLNTQENIKKDSNRYFAEKVRKIVNFISQI